MVYIVFSSFISDEDCLERFRICSELLSKISLKKQSWDQGRDSQERQQKHNLPWTQFETSLRHFETPENTYATREVQKAGERCAFGALPTDELLEILMMKVRRHRSSRYGTPSRVEMLCVWTYPMALWRAWTIHIETMVDLTCHNIGTVFGCKSRGGQQVHQQLQCPKYASSSPDNTWILGGN